MRTKAKPIEELVKELSPAKQEAVRAFAESLLGKRTPRPRNKPQFQWAGALKDLRNRFTSVELQHQLARLRIDCE